MLTVCATATTTGGLTTTTRVRDALRTSATSDDNVQQDLINRATDWSGAVLGYPVWGVETYQETVAAYGRRHLRLSRTPVRAILRAFSGTDTGTATEYTTSTGSGRIRLEDAEAGFLSRDAGFAWTVALGPSAVRLGGMGLGIQSDPDPAFGERRPWLVEYLAGWTLDGVSSSSDNYSTGSQIYGTTSTGRTLPYDVEQAVILKAADWYSGGSGISSKSVGDLSISYASAGQGQAQADALLRPYRRLDR